MIAPIIWSVVAVAIIIFTVSVGLLNWYGIALICFAVACVFFQWLAYFKKKNSK